MAWLLFLTKLILKNYLIQNVCTVQKLEPMNLIKVLDSFPLDKYDIRVDFRVCYIRRFKMDEMLSDALTNAAGTSGLVSMIVSLLCVVLSWWALQNLKLDLFIRYPKSPQGRLLHLLLAIVLGHFVAGFILDYLNWSGQIRYMF